MGGKLDTRAIGLDAGLHLVKWLTGAENLHYGLWDGLEPSAQNLGRAQAAYTAMLLDLLPPGPLRILDIGGGAGETAAKLIALGHTVEIVVPSPLLAERCRANAPGAVVHLTTFEDFTGRGPFDLCLFSESFQYIPLTASLPRCAELLGPGGTVLIADCFRTEAGREKREIRPVGGGHPVGNFRAAVAVLPFEVQLERDITEAVAPSIDVEAGLFRVFGHAVGRVDEELARKRPRTRWALLRLWRNALSERTRLRLAARLAAEGRTAEEFRRHNRYLVVRLGRV